jgi:hypothetical protein
VNASNELDQIIASGVTFTLAPVDGLGFSVRIGDYEHEPVVSAVLPTFERAVAWLIEQVKTRYPDCEYSRRRLIN